MTFPKKQIYLAGPISGLTHDEARYGWRKDFVDMLEAAGLDHIHCFSPMRGKEFLAQAGVLTSTGVNSPAHAMATDAGITTRDLNDVKNCDAMVACFLESEGRPSLGTAIEYGFAAAFQKPIVAIGHLGDPNISHLMMQRLAGYHLLNLEDSIPLVAHLLTPGI